MWKKVLVGGSVAAVIVGAGGVALAATGSSSPSPSPSSSASTAHHGKRGGRLRERAKDAVRGQIVTKDGSTFVTHDGIRGTVTAVSTSSITVKAADGTSETFVVNGSTLVHTKADGKSKGSAGAISSVRTGDDVGVTGTGTSTFTADHVLDLTR